MYIYNLYHKQRYHVYQKGTTTTTSTTTTTTTTTALHHTTSRSCE